MNETKHTENEFDVVTTSQGAQLRGEAQLHPHEIKRRSLRGVFFYLFRTFLLTGITGIVQLILPAVLGPAQYGVFGIVVAISGFFTIISDIGLAASLIQKKEEPTTLELRTVFTTQQILTWSVFGLIVVTAVVLHNIGKLPLEGVYLALAFGVAFPIVSLKTISSILLERDLRFGKLVIPAIAESLVFNTIAVVLALHHFGVMSFTYAVLAQAIVGVIVMLCIKRWDFGIAFSKKAFFQLMKIGGGFELNDILAKAKDDLFYITAALLMSPQQYGYITFAKQWSSQPYSLTVDNVSALTFPAYSRMQHDPTLLRKAIEKTMFFVTLVAFPLLGGMAVMAHPFIHVFPIYAKWQPALVALSLYSFSLAFASFSTPLVNTLNAIGKISQTLKMMLFWTVSQWVLAPFFFHFFGYLAVPLIGAVLAFTSIYVVVLVKKYVNFNFIENIWRQAIASIVMVIILQMTTNVWSHSVVQFAAGIFIGAVMYVSMIFITVASSSNKVSLRI